MAKKNPAPEREFRYQIHAEAEQKPCVIKMTHKKTGQIAFMGSVPFKDEHENTEFQKFEEAKRYPYPSHDVAAAVIASFDRTRNIQYSVVDCNANQDELGELHGVWVFMPQHAPGVFLLDGRQIVFTSREKALAFEKTGKTKGFQLTCVTLSQSKGIVPAVVDPSPANFERVTYERWPVARR